VEKASSFVSVKDFERFLGEDFERFLDDHLIAVDVSGNPILILIV